MPRIQLTEKERVELAPDTLEEPTHEMDDTEYLARRDALIDEAEQKGDFDTVDALLERYPHPGLLTQQQIRAETEEKLKAEIEARRPQDDDQRAEFLKGLDEIPDGDKQAVSDYLAQHGMEGNWGGAA